MKLNTANRAIESGGMKVNVGFTIDMNAKAFNVLSDGMYSDAVKSIVRELSSNAYDSHVAAGTPELPFEVSCPNGFDPYFAVKDYGVGLRYFKFDSKVVNEHDGESTVFIDGDIRNDIENITLMVVNEVDTFAPSAILYDKSENRTVIRIAGNVEGNMPVEFDDALVLYSTYFRSTKEDSNDFVGAFGLGSKTPFAYTDNFQVTNVYGGVKSVFNVYTDEHGQPQISIMGRFDTDEVNGLEVKIAVQSDDYFKFREAIASELKYFDPKPTILNEEVDIPQIIHEGENFFLMDRDISAHRCNFAMGNNSYEVDSWNLDVHKVFRIKLALRFAIGELQPTSNREDLRIEPEHRQLISDRSDAALKEYGDYILSTVQDDDMSEHERIMFATEHSEVIPINDERIMSLINNPNYNYTQHSVRIPLGWGAYSDVEFQTNDEGDLFLCRQNYGGVHRPLNFKTFRHTMMKRETFNGNFINYEDNVHIYIKDTSHSFMKKIRHHANENGVSVNNHTILVIDKPQCEQSKLALDALKEVIRNLSITNISDIELPKNQSITTSATRDYTTPVGRLMPDGYCNFMNGTSMWDEMYTPLTKVEQEEDMYIVEMFRNDLQNNEDFTYLDQRFLQVMKNSGKLEGVTLIALSTAKYNKALTYGFQPVSELVSALKKEVVVDNGFANQNVFKEVLDAKLDSTSYYSDDYNHRIHQILEFSDVIDGDNDLGHLIRAFKVLNSRYGTQARSRWNRDRELAEVLELNIEPNPKFVEVLDNLVEFCDNVWNKVKVIEKLSQTHFSEDELKDVGEFLNWKLENTGA
jgi:hypothetical protein